MKSRLPILAFVAIFTCSASIAAEQLPLKAGVYEIFTSAIVGNNAIGGAARSRCIPDEDLADPERVFVQEVPRGRQKQEQPSEWKIENGKISYLITREDRAIAVNGTVSAEEFAVFRRTTIKTGGAGTTILVEGKRTGDCNK